MPESESAQESLAAHFPTRELGSFQYPDLIAHLSLQVADDLCLIEAQGRQRLLAASVCSPTYWDVREKIGQSLADIHQPVTTLEEKIGSKVARSISNAPLLTPFERVNWFIHADQERFHPEAVKIEGEPSGWFVRSERETICRFHEDFALFTINVRFAELREIQDYPDARRDLIKSLESFDREEVEYFGGQSKYQQLIEYLRG